MLCNQWSIAKVCARYRVQVALVKIHIDKTKTESRLVAGLNPRLTIVETRLNQGATGTFPGFLHYKCNK